MPNRVHLGVERNGTAWREQAVCKPENGYDPELWFPAGGALDTSELRPFGTRTEQRRARRRRMMQEAEAKALCLRCPVRAECLQYADDNDEREGIWGGLTPQERGKQPLR